MPLLRWSNPGHDTRRASSLVREAGCREINLHIRRWENNVLDIPFYRSLLRKMPLLRWSNPGHDTRRASSLVREAGCREINLHIRRWENNVLDIPFYRAGRYTQNPVLGILSAIGMLQHQSCHGSRSVQWCCMQRVEICNGSPWFYARSALRRCPDVPQRAFSGVHKLPIED